MEPGKVHNPVKLTRRNGAGQISMAMPSVAESLIEPWVGRINTQHSDSRIHDRPDRNGPSDT